jgi:hypothetical protein
MVSQGWNSTPGNVDGVSILHLVYCFKKKKKKKKKKKSQKDFLAASFFPGV